MTCFMTIIFISIFDVWHFVNKRLLQILGFSSPEGGLKCHKFSCSCPFSRRKRKSSRKWRFKVLLWHLPHISYDVIQVCYYVIFFSPSHSSSQSEGGGGSISCNKIRYWRKKNVPVTLCSGEHLYNFPSNLKITMTFCHKFHFCMFSECDLLPSISRGASYYRRMTPWGKWLDMPCSLGTVFIQEKCKCDRPNQRKCKFWSACLMMY